MRIRHSLTYFLVIPAVGLIFLVAFFAEGIAKKALERALGNRLVSIAQATATTLSPRLFLLEEGDDQTRLKKAAAQKLESLRDKTQVRRIVVGKLEPTIALVDSNKNFAVGDEYLRAQQDEHELSLVRAGQGVASVLFSGPEGALYKTGYAPLLNAEEKVRGFVAVDATPTYDRALKTLRTWMIALFSFALFLLLALSRLLARNVVKPLDELSQSAARIGQGQLDTEIPKGGPREATILAQAMEEMTAALRAREEELQMMLAGIAHEVRNPLGGIELFGGLLKEDLPSDDPRQKHVEKILKELKVLAKVVTDFLDFARHDVHEPTATNLHDLLASVVMIAEAEASEKRITLRFNAKSESFLLDPEAIKRALLNLVSNAIQAGAEGTQVDISAELQEQHCRLVVEDSGPGIPEATLAEIFTPFFTTKEKGTGLGLALVKKTAETHKGRIWAENKPQGGARFVLELSQPPQ